MNDNDHYFLDHHDEQLRKYYYYGLNNNLKANQGGLQARTGSMASGLSVNSQDFIMSSDGGQQQQHAVHNKSMSSSDGRVGLFQRPLKNM